MSTARRSLRRSLATIAALATVLALLPTVMAQPANAATVADNAAL